MKCVRERRQYTCVSCKFKNCLFLLVCIFLRLRFRFSILLYHILYQPLFGCGCDDDDDNDKDANCVCIELWISAWLIRCRSSVGLPRLNRIKATAVERSRMKTFEKIYIYMCVRATMNVLGESRHWQRSSVWRFIAFKLCVASSVSVPHTHAVHGYTFDPEPREKKINKQMIKFTFHVFSLSLFSVTASRNTTNWRSWVYGCGCVAVEKSLRKILM